MPAVPATKERLRQEESLNPEGRGCSEPRWHPCTPACVTERDPVSKKENCLKVEREKERWGEMEEEVRRHTRGGDDRDTDN